MLDIRELSITETKPAIAILVKGKLSISQIQHDLVLPLRTKNITNDLYVSSLSAKGKKPLVAEVKSHCQQMLPALSQLGVTMLLVTDSTYFGVMTGIKAKPAEYEGFAFPCVIQGYEHMTCILGVHPYVCLINPDRYTDQDYALETIKRYLTGKYKHPGSNVIHYEAYPESVSEISQWLDHLLEYPELTCDIETLSLKHIYAGLGTISFAWSKHEGIAFSVSMNRSYEEAVEILKLLNQFFTKYQGKLTYHNAGYDVKQLIYMLFMKTPWDYEGLLYGLEVMTRNIDDTKIISYLATNSAAGNRLGLKQQAKEFLGKYSEKDIEDITKIPLPQLLQYNLKDCLGTWYTKEKNYPIMVADQQESVYFDVFKPAIKQIIQMELTGLPVNPHRVMEVDDELTTYQNSQLEAIQQHPVVLRFMEESEIPALVVAKNAEYKKKVIDSSYFVDRVFNPNSNAQLSRLLFEFIGFEVTSYTPAKQPSTDRDALTELYAKALELGEQSIADLVKAIMEFTKVNKVVTAFIPAFRDAFLFPDNIARVFGSFNLGGTVSGRLSSCLVGETKVQCKDGTKRLDEIQKGTLVLTHTGRYKSVLNVFDNKEHFVYLITLSDGKTLTCTSNHRLLTEYGFLSLEDMYNESAAQIRRRIITGNAGSFNSLPHIAIKPAKTNSAGKICKNSRSILHTSIPRRTQEKKNILKATNAKRTFGKCVTKRATYLYRKHIFKFGRNSENFKGTSSYIKTVYTRTNWRNRISKNIWIKEILSENQSNSEMPYSDSKILYRKICRPSRIYISSNSLLDEKRKQIFLRASSSNTKTIRARRIACRLGGTPYKWGQNRQSNRQLSSNDCSGAYDTPCRMYTPIIKIDYVGVRRVYDLEIAEDHCYLANDIYVHNSNPNLQNIPSNSTHAKLIKSCVQAPEGWLFVGLDFALTQWRK